MKKMKKILALIMAMAMVLGMGITTLAATDTTGNITVTGLVKESTTVSVYKVVSADQNVNEWEIEEWAINYVTLNEGTNQYSFDWADLNDVKTEGVLTDRKTTSSGEVEFEGLPLGAYLIVATTNVDGSTTVYNPMGAVTYKYNEESHLMVGNDATVYAKASSVPVQKEADDNFVAKGQTVTFTVTTTFPAFTEGELVGASFIVTDTSDDLLITEVVSVKIGDTNIEGCEGEGIQANNTYQYIIDLSDQIGDGKENAGKTVEIKYEATVLEEDGYTNSVHVFKNGVDFGEDDEEGYSADITITKVNEDEATLSGAKFNVYKSDATTVAGAKNTDKLYFTLVDGVYELASEDASGATTDIVTGGNGTVKVAGLDEGTYWFDEIEAPKGYSINTEGVKVEVSDRNDAGESVSANVSKNGEMVDTKLASLPSTGGIGTTIFTVGGCLIMIAAAALYFMNRRRDEE